MKVIFTLILLIVWVLGLMSIKPKEVEAGTKGELHSTLPDKYGVVCYRDARLAYADPISCVKVQ